jgi:hypothetical protein
VTTPPEGYQPPFVIYAVERTDQSGGSGGQVGAFSSVEEAERLRARLEAEGETLFINAIPVHQRWQDYEYDR